MRRQRRGLSLLEVLVVVALLATLVALALPAVQNVRHSAARIQIANNLKQVILAMHTYRNTYGYFPAASTTVTTQSGRSRTKTYSLHLLSYLDNGANNALNDEGEPSSGVWPVIPVFTAPLDATCGDFQRVQNYACNLRVFTEAGLNTPWNENIPLDLLSPTMAGVTNLAAFTDGLSNTVALATRYGNFGSTGYGGNVSCSAYDGAITQTEGAFFGVYVMTGQANARGSTFGWQLAPTISQVNCSWEIGMAHSFDTRGLQIALCDGCVRSINPAMSARTWNLALQPNDGNPLGTDWW